MIPDRPGMYWDLVSTLVWTSDFGSYVRSAIVYKRKRKVTA